MERTFTNSDRMLQIVLSDEKLVAYAEYDYAEYQTIDQALSSGNPIVVAVAKIINGLHCKNSDKEIYNEVSNYLKNNIL